MSGKVCAVFGCKNFDGYQISKSFFRFPRDKAVCDQWVIKCRRSDLDDIYKQKGPVYLYSTYRICSDHFQSTDFRNPRLYSQGLKPNSVPTQNLPSSSVQGILGSKRRGSPRKRKREEKDVEHNGTSPSTSSAQVQPTDCLPDARRPKSVSNEVKLKILSERLRKAQKTICRKNALIAKLKGEVCRLENNKMKTKSQLIKYFGNSTTPLQQFFKDQVKNFGRKSRGRRFTDNDKTVALAIYYCSSRAYKFLKKLVCLPSVRSLQRWLENLGISPGLNETILSLMKVKAEQLSVSKRVVSIVLDEMSLQDNISYNARTDEFDGFVNHGGHKLNGVPVLAHDNQAMVVLIRGIKINFKQVIAYYLTRDGMSGECIKDILLEVVRKVTDTGFIPKAIVCDQGSNNLKMRSLLNISEGKPFIEMCNNKVYFFLDAPHLLKSVRNNLKSYDLICEDGRASWSHIVQFYDKDSVMKPRLAPRLTRKCIDLPPFSRMRVCLAARVFSHSVSCGIRTQVAFNSMPEETLPTANFIAKMDSLFDIFNSSLKYCEKELRCAISDERKHFVYLNELSQFLKSMTVMNSQRKKPPCIKGWVENISALKLLWQELKTQYDFRYLLTRRLTQDCLENVFSIVRSKGGNNLTPDSSKFRQSLRLAITNQLLQPSEDSNCTMDASKFLVVQSDLQKKCKPFAMQTPSVNNPVQGGDSIPVTIVQQCADSYVCSWICAELPHEECRDRLVNLNGKCDKLNAVHVVLKQYENDRPTFLFHNESAQIMYDRINNLFKEKFIHYLSESRLNVKLRLKNSLNCDVLLTHVCENCKDVFVDKGLNVLIKCYLSEENGNSNRNQGKNIKAKIIMHM